MTVLQYMNQTGMQFWRSGWVGLATALGEWGAFSAFAGAYGEYPWAGRRGRLLLAALLAAWLGLQFMRFQVAIHCLALILLCAVFLCLLNRCAWFNGVFAGSLFCLYLELGKSVCRDGLVAQGLSRLLPGLGGTAMNLVLLGLYFAWLGLLCLLLKRRRRRLLDLPITFAQALGLLFPLFLYLAVRLFQYAQVEHLDNAQWLRYDLLQYAVAVCALLVMQTTEGMLASQVEVSELAHRQLLTEQRQQQYELQRETLDFINRRWHDMKHYLNGIELLLSNREGVGGADAAQAGALIDGLRQGIDLYGGMQKTGSPVLDVLLFQRARQCMQEGIRLTPYIDATRAGFITTLDMSVLFGNAMDNAVEAVRTLSDPALREISVKIGPSDGLLLMRFYNRFEGPRRRERERWLTTKADERSHGYGLSSIAAVAEKYGGAATVECGDGEFTLHVLIPLPEQEQEGATP